MRVVAFVPFEYDTTHRHYAWLAVLLHQPKPPFQERFLLKIHTALVFAVLAPYVSEQELCFEQLWHFSLSPRFAIGFVSRRPYPVGLCLFYLFSIEHLEDVALIDSQCFITITSFISPFFRELAETTSLKWNSGIRTHALYIPNVAPYLLGYIPVTFPFCFCNWLWGSLAVEPLPKYTPSPVLS